MDNFKKNFATDFEYTLNQKLQTDIIKLSCGVVYGCTEGS